MERLSLPFNGLLSSDPSLCVQLSRTKFSTPVFQEATGRFALVPTERGTCQDRYPTFPATAAKVPDLPGPLRANTSAPED